MTTNAVRIEDAVQKINGYPRLVEMTTQHRKRALGEGGEFAIPSLPALLLKSRDCRFVILDLALQILLVESRPRQP